MKLNSREATAILVALRHWQDTGDNTDYPEYFDASDMAHSDDDTPMDDEEIGALCEKINLDSGDEVEALYQTKEKSCKSGD